MALAIPRHVAEQLSPDLAEYMRKMIDKITALAAYNDREFMDHHLDLFEKRVRWNAEKADAEIKRRKQSGSSR